MFGLKETGIGAVAGMYTAMVIGRLQEEGIVMNQDDGNIGEMAIIGEAVAGTGKSRIYGISRF